MGALPFITSISPHRGFLTMAFRRSRSTSEMAQYVVCNFKWDRRRAAFPPSPLPNYFQALGPSYNLAVTEGAARCFKFPELPQVIFYAMLLSKAKRLRVLHRWTLYIMESALIVFRWGTCESWVWLNGDRILEARPSKRMRARTPKGPPPLRTMTSRRRDSEEEKIEREREKVSLARPLLAWCSLFFTTPGRWLTLSATRPPRPLLDNYQDLCPRFALPDAERTTLDFELPEMVQAIFYATPLNDAVKLGVVSGPMAIDLKLTLEGLRWSPFKSYLGRSSRGLMEAQFHQRTPSDGARELADDQEESSRTEVIEGRERRMASFLAFLDTAHVAEYVRDNFHWPLRESSALHSKLLPLNFHGLCPNFDLHVAMQFAHMAYIPEMVQPIFYAMVIIEAVELELSSKTAIDRMI
ncbi:hypothetical protein Cgig2_028574 [Carnegiea gigantea]|uniref:Uncharacterized protein n=1 Tax=Carnegiea gigantea TaxID=171969 RepID=A0A9Q1K2B6_9CARY|nr:hypothetical protein Cgig2_028574 [Carnegiea gigantea]